jgi:hypothetical protein
MPHNNPPAPEVKKRIQKIDPSADFTRYHSVFIKGINRAQSMVPVCDHNFLLGRIPHQKQRGYFFPRLNFLLILFDVAVADREQGQSGGPENILGFVFRHLCAFQLFHPGLGGLLITKQAEVG